MSWLQEQRSRLARVPHLPYILAAFGGLLYLWLASGYIFSLRSILDEGLYLLKGYYFAIGKYQPFQDYGPLTNHMPLSFIIPGYIQDWFGPGLRVARYYSLITGMVMLAGLWLAARRLAGPWWAAFVVWAVTLNVALVKNYSVAFSQVLVAALLAWTLAFALGKRVKLWQAAAAGLLAGALLMTRINMAPVLFFLVIYLYFQFSARHALSAALAGGAVILLVHALYWPGILRMWANWLPTDIFAFLQPFETPWKKYTIFVPSPFNIWIRDLDDSTWNPIIAFWHGVRFNFVAIVGVLGSLLLWPRRRDWQRSHKFITLVFLVSLFLILLGLHMWAALSGASCTMFCFSGYVGFFNGLGLLALVAAIPFWRRESGPTRSLLFAAAVIILFVGVGFGAADDIGAWVAELSIPGFLARTATGEAVPAWAIMQNRFNLALPHARQVLPAVAGLLLGILFLVGLLTWSNFSKHTRAANIPYTATVLLVVAGLLLAPSSLLGGGDETLDCGGDVVSAYEDAGRQLASVIQSGDYIYYHATNSPIPLLYLDGVEIYPAQLNNVFAFSPLTGEDITDGLLRFGFWNETLKQQWADEADVILLEGRRYAEWEPLVASGEFNVSLVTDPVEQCRGKDSELVVLRRIE